MNSRLKKSLYESIMKNVAKTVKRTINEAGRFNNGADKFRGEKAKAIKNVPEFAAFASKEIKVLANSRLHPYTVSMAYLDYGDPYIKGYVFIDVTTNTRYALTAEEVSEVLNSMSNPRERRKMLIDYPELKTEFREDSSLIVIPFVKLEGYEF